MTQSALAKTLDATYNVPFHSHRKIDVAQALKMRLKGYSYRAIADQFGVTKQAACAALKGFTQVIKDPGLGIGYVENKCDILDTTEAHLVTKLLDPKRLEKASVNNLAYAISQLDHIKRLERGQSTDNIDVLAVSADLETLQDQLQGVRQARARIANKGKQG